MPPLPWTSLLAPQPGAADRALVVGLDCASPWLLFERWRAHLPQLDALMRGGIWGRLRSCHPPITVPAWMVMASGQDAGEQGVYGFRNRVPGGAPGQLQLAMRDLFQGTPLWESLGQEGLRSTVLGVPGTWPPRPLQGKLIPGPLTPQDAPRSWPPELMQQVDEACGGYLFDVEDFRGLAPEALVQEVTLMTRRRFAAARALAQEDDWNLFWMVEMGLDRLHHALWDAVDPQHPRHQPGSPLAQALLDYYILLDEEIGRLWRLCDDGLTSLLVVSDHGARSMLGGVCVNRWLIQEGYLVLLPGQEDEPGRFDPARVDWSRTRAWSMGGYCARVFVHQQGRDPGGVVPPGQVEALLAELAQGLEALPDPSGRPMATQARRSQELFAQRRGAAPDLMVYFGDLAWRAIDTIGGSGLYTRSNDTGPDAANHDWDGVLVMSGAGIRAQGEVQGASLLHIAPALRHLLGAQGEEA